MNLFVDEKLRCELEVANTFWTRLVGLIGRRSCENAMLFTNTKRVHTFFMSMDIDVVFCNSKNEVLFVQSLRPFRVSKRVNDASCVIEMSSGGANAFGIRIGSKLEFR